MPIIRLAKVLKAYDSLKALNEAEFSELMSMWGDIEFKGEESK